MKRLFSRIYKMKWLLVILALLAVGKVSCMLIFPDYVKRFRLEFEVKADGKIHSGSSVIEVTWKTIDPDRRWNSKFQGQGAIIDLGSHGILVSGLVGTIINEKGYAVRSNVAMNYLILRAFAGRVNGLPPLSDGDIRGRQYTLNKDVINAYSNLSGAVSLEDINLPLFFWLKDPLDPRTAVWLQADEFSTVIGEGVELKSAVLRITSDSISSDMLTKLPWVPNMIDRSYNIPRTDWRRSYLFKILRGNLFRE